MRIKAFSKKLYWLRNKYLLTVLGFAIWMFFIDANNLPLQRKRINELKQLQQSELLLDKQISDAKTELSLLKTSPATIEKYAREKYLMKRDNEDLYIIKNK